MLVKRLQNKWDKFSKNAQTIFVYIIKTCKKLIYVL